MKAIKLLTVFTLFFTALNLTSCASDDEPVDPHVYDVVLPTVTTTAVTSITGITAVSGGTVTSDGNGTVIARGVVWSTSENPTIANAKTVDGGGTGVYTSNLIGLSASTTYYVRAYVENEMGIAYGEQVSFTTPTNLPTLTTTAIGSITTTTASSGGTITLEGSSSVTARGVVWSTIQNPTTSNSKTVDGTGIGTFTSNITALTAGTTYYVRAYATNSFGTAYGNQVTFVTLP